MTASTEQEAFGRLPEELRIKIAKFSTDPLALQSLAHASPVMGRVLDRYPLEIVEVVLDVAVPVQTRRLMDAVLKARLLRFPASMSEAQKVAKTHSTTVTDELCSSRPVRAAVAVRSLLATAKNVHTWSHACLEHLIRKSMELRPSTLISLGTGSTTREQFENAESRNDYLPQYTGPPSWVEEQRMIKAFWRLQFFLELQSAGNKGRLGTGWPAEEVDLLSKSTPDNFYDMFDFEQEQTLTASDFLGGATSRTITSVEVVHNDATGLPTIRWIEGALPRCSCAEPLSFELNMDTFRQGPENLDLTPKSYFFQRTMSTTYPEGMPPTLVFPFQPWRKYGFAIWDDKRMIDLGMRHPKAKSIFRKYISYSFRWWSILTEEDLHLDLNDH